MRPSNVEAKPLDEATKYRPRYLDVPCPDKYRYICGYCSKRFGDPDRFGWIDIVRCEACDAKIKKHEN